MSEELKPCPFCGTQPTEYDQIGYSSVKCKPCNFSIKVKSIDGPPYAPELWNTRTLPQPAAVEVVPFRWTGNPDADLALVLIGRIDAPEDEARLEQLEQIVMRLGKAATVPAGCKVVPVELLERLAISSDCYDPDQSKAVEELRAILEVKS